MDHRRPSPLTEGVSFSPKSSDRHGQTCVHQIPHTTMALLAEVCKDMSQHFSPKSVV